MNNEAPAPEQLTKKVCPDGHIDCRAHPASTLREVVYRRVDPPVASTSDLKKRARQIIDTVIKSPVIVEVRVFSQPQEVDRLEDRIVALLTKPIASPAAPDERDTHAIHEMFSEYGDWNDVGRLKTKLAEYVATVRAEGQEAQEKIGRQAFAAELLGHLDRITSTTAAYHFVRNTCKIELGLEPDSLGAEFD